MRITGMRKALARLIAAWLAGAACWTQIAGAEGPVEISKELMIVDLAVIEDPIRTDPHEAERAVWTFKYLMEQLAGDTDPADFVLQWLKAWTLEQSLNGSLSPARPQIWDKVIGPWLAASGGEKLDLTLAPFKLLAIVNRMDLRARDGDTIVTAGEGRLVFGVLDPDGDPLPPVAGPAAGGFTVIFEYELAAQTPNALTRWATLWHRLSRFELGSRQYNRQLEKITKRFTDRQPRRYRARVNQSGLKQVRTNEIALDQPWEMREFRLDPHSGQLVQHPVAHTPDFAALNGTQALADLINQNEASLLAGSFVLPSALLAASTPVGPFTLQFLQTLGPRTFSAHESAPGAPVFDVPWSAAGIQSNEARHTFALQTCGGCHRDETGTGFLHIGFPHDHDLPVSLGTPAQLSAFLTGTEQPDPVEGTTMRHFNDLERRQADFAELLNSFVASP
jgi:hypothetical protein